MYLYTSNFGFPLWPIGAVLLLVFIYVNWRRKRNASYLFFFSLFWVYAMYGIDKVFFPLEISGTMVDEMRKVSILSHINIIPFYYGNYGITISGLISSFFNCLLTMPLGFGLSFITNVKMKNFLVISVLVGLGIEFVQFAISLALRYPYRVIDINDTIFNAIGVLIGYSLFRLSAWLYLLVTRRLQLEHTGLSLYIFNVFNTETE